GKVTGGYNATANVLTNGSGNLVSILMSNIGCSFTNTSNITATFSAGGGGASNGSGAILAYSIGSTLITEQTDNMFANCIVTNVDIDDINPFFTISNPVGTTYTLDFATQYYLTNDNTVSSGFVAY